MIGNGEGPDHPAEDHFRKWLAGRMSGCLFAAKIAKAPERVLFARFLEEPDEELARQLTIACEEARASQRFPIALFPRVRQARDVVRLVNILRKDPRWSATAVQWGRFPRSADAVALSLQWTTAEGFASQAMGFAPLGSMPVTRRAPYVALALWPGGHDNPHFSKGRANSVSFADGFSGLDAEKHQAVWEQSEDLTKQLLSDPADDRVWLRRVAFCVPRDIVEELAPDLSSATPSPDA